MTAGVKSAEVTRNQSLAVALSREILDNQRCVDRHHGIRRGMTHLVDHPGHRGQVARNPYERNTVRITFHHSDSGMIPLNLPGHIEAEEWVIHTSFSFSRLRLSQFQKSHSHPHGRHCAVSDSKSHPLVAPPMGTVSISTVFDLPPVSRGTLAKSATDQSHAREDAHASDRPGRECGAALAARDYPVGTVEAFVGREPPLVKADTLDCDLAHRLSLENLPRRTRTHILVQAGSGFGYAALGYAPPTLPPAADDGGPHLEDRSHPAYGHRYRDAASSLSPTTVSATACN
jgi:hypothetical protein